MAWADSRIFRPFLGDVLSNTAAFDLSGTPDTFKVALFDNDITPNNDVTAANSAFGAGVWTTSGASGAEEVYHAGQWSTGGVALTSPSIDTSIADTVFFDASDTASGAAATLTNVYGCLVYDDTLTTPVADQGVCYNYLGGANSVTTGTFTVVWHGNGIFRFTL